MEEAGQRFDKTDLGARVNQHVDNSFQFPAQGTDLQVKLPPTANPAHGVQGENLRPFQKLDKQPVQLVGTGLAALPVPSYGPAEG